MRRGILIAVMVLGSGFAVPAASTATVTIGANLSADSSPLAPNCNVTHQCTLMTAPSPAPAGLTAPGGFDSPVTGTIVGWRVRTGAFSSQTVRLRVLRPSAAAGSFTGAGASAPVTNPVDQISPTNATDLQIQAGDGIGLDCCQGGTGTSVMGIAPGANLLLWGVAPNNLLGEGETRPSDFTQSGRMLMVQADIEPANDPDPGKLTRKGRSVKVFVDLPNAGELTVKGARKGLVKPKTLAAPAGNSFVKLKLAAAVRRELSSGNSVKLKLRFLFTPQFGVQGVDTAKGKLKP
jgi:hypothetical protein